MNTGKRYDFPKAYKEKIKPPVFLIKAANSTLSKANKIITATQKKLDKKANERCNIDSTTSESDVLTNTNSNTDDWSELSRPTDSISTPTTSVASLAGTDNKEHTLETTPLPKPICKLGDIQAEWEGGESGWKLIPVDASSTKDPLNTKDLTKKNLSLKDINKNLKNEEQLLETKIEILLNSVSDQITLVNSYEKKLEKLRSKVKHDLDYSENMHISNQLPHPIPARDEWLRIKDRKNNKIMASPNHEKLKFLIKSDDILTQTKKTQDASFGTQDSQSLTNVDESSTETSSDQEDDSVSSQTEKTTSTTSSEQSQEVTTTTTSTDNQEQSESKESDSTITAATTKTKTVQFAE